MNIGKVIKTLRKGRKLTQQQCADNMGVSRSTWADTEMNRQSPSVDTLERMALAMGIDLQEQVERYVELFMGSMDQ